MIFQVRSSRAIAFKSSFSSFSGRNGLTSELAGFFAGVLFSFFFSLLAMAAKILFQDFYSKFYTDCASVTLPIGSPVVHASTLYQTIPEKTRTNCYLSMVLPESGMPENRAYKTYVLHLEDSYSTVCKRTIRLFLY